ncbi:UNVERIFIED_CONTAM: hypothetical protein K2H54_055668, partial [Gekko kuhli]
GLIPWRLSQFLPALLQSRMDFSGTHQCNEEGRKKEEMSRRHWRVLLSRQREKEGAFWHWEVPVAVTVFSYPLQIPTGLTHPWGGGPTPWSFVGMRLSRRF